LSTLFANAHVVTMDDAGTEFEGGWILVEDGSVKDAGAGAKPEADALQDLAVAPRRSRGPWPGASQQRDRESHVVRGVGRAGSGCASAHARTTHAFWREPTGRAASAPSSGVTFPSARRQTRRLAARRFMESAKRRRAPSSRSSLRGAPPRSWRASEPIPGGRGCDPRTAAHDPGRRRLRPASSLFPRE